MLYFRCYDTKKEIFFGYRYHIHESDEELEKVGRYSPGAFEILLGQNQDSGEIELKESSIYDIFKRPFLSLKKSGDKYKYSGIGSKLFKKIERKTILDSSPTNFLFSPNTILSNLESNEEDENGEKIKGDTDQFSKGFSQFLSAISYNNSRARRYFGELSFLGPIRENPHRIYEITNETYNTVGSRGENMPNLLKKIGDNNAELNDWIKRFGFGDRIELKHHYSNTYSIRFRNENEGEYYTSIANAGFGASQVLPLILQSLVSPKKSITVAEQPEIHLNPKIQCVLAELFISMAKKGQTIITETHSEHLLLSLRRLVAKGDIDSEDVAIYFVEKEGKKSKIREIKLQENGHIKPIDWPKDFFAETLKESIALASEQAKRKKND